MCKIWDDFGQLQTSIANISGMAGDTQSQQTNEATTPLKFGRAKNVQN